MESIEYFQHEPLNTSEPSIRVVRILPGEVDGIIACSLTEIPLRNTHSCLSYVCGDPKAARETVLVNGNPYSVLPNLWSFLHQARELRIYEPIWIDSISIDQGNIPERNRQVRQMTDIYRQAKHVIVWPGHVEWRKLSLSIEEAEQEGFQLHHSHASGWVDLSDNPEAEQLMLHVTAKKLFHNNLLRSYFARTWTCQEMLLSRNKSIILSGRLERWDDVAQLMMDCWDRSEKWIKTDEFQKGLETSMVTVQHNHIPGVEESTTPPRFLRLLQQSIQRPHKTLSLDELVEVSKESACSEPRDHLYGLLGLIENGRNFPVDYSQPKERILFDALEYFVPKIGTDFQNNFVSPYTRLSFLFGTDVGPLCKPCALGGRPDYNSEIYGRDLFHTSLANKTDLPVEFLLTPVKSVACYRIRDDRLRMYHNHFGYCQACRKGIFNFSGYWPTVLIAFFRQSPTRLWVTVSKAKIFIRHRISDKLRGVGRRLDSGHKKHGGGQVHVRYGNDLPTITSLHRAATNGDKIE